MRLPNEKERKEILNIHLSKRKTVVTDEVLTEVASQTSEFTGSELENLVNEASFAAFRRKRLNLHECSINDEDLILSCKQAVEEKETLKKNKYQPPSFNGFNFHHAMSQS